MMCGITEKPLVCGVPAAKTANVTGFSGIQGAGSSLGQETDAVEAFRIRAEGAGIGDLDAGSVAGDRRLEGLPGGEIFTPVDLVGAVSDAGEGEVEISAGS